MGAAMAVILANLWLKKFEDVLAQQQPTEIQAKTPPVISNIWEKGQKKLFKDLRYSTGSASGGSTEVHSIHGSRS